LTRRDALADSIALLASASGVALRGPFRSRVDVGGIEAQRMWRGVASVEALNASGEWEVWASGSESEVLRLVEACKRLFSEPDVDLLNADQIVPPYPRMCYLSVMGTNYNRLLVYAAYLALGGLPLSVKLSPEGLALLWNRSGAVLVAPNVAENFIAKSPKAEEEASP
jgi:hypothetical protein